MGKSIKLKLIVLGDQFSGKSSILNRYKNDEFIDYSVSTIGVDFVTKTINKDDNKYILNMWDTSGQEKFNSIITSYYRNIIVALLVFDLSNTESFLNLKNVFLRRKIIEKRRVRALFFMLSVLLIISE